MNVMVSQRTNSDGKGLLGSIIGERILFEGIDEILQRKVSKIGNSGHISVPSKHIGKKATVTIWSDAPSFETGTSGAKSNESLSPIQ